MWYGICDFDPGLGVAEHKSFFDACEGRMFLSKFSSQGDFQWADVWGYPCDIYDYERAAGVAATPGGSAYVVGQFAKTTDFDPGPGEDLHTVTGYPYYVGNDCYLTKFPPDGIW
jgi:hypothetical protein